MKLELLQDLDLHHPWSEAEQSSILVLSGLNYHAYKSGLYLSGLSPLATDLAHRVLSGSFQKGERSCSMFLPVETRTLGIRGEARFQI